MQLSIKNTYHIVTNTNKNTNQIRKKAYILASIFNVKFFRGDVIKKFVVFSLFNAAESVRGACFEFNLEVERPGKLELIIY